MERHNKQIDRDQIRSMLTNRMTTEHNSTPIYCPLRRTWSSVLRRTNYKFRNHLLKIALNSYVYSIHVYGC